MVNLYYISWRGQQNTLKPFLSFSLYNLKCDRGNWSSFIYLVQPLTGLMLKLKLQYSGHLMWRTNSFEKTLMLGKTEGGRRRGWEKMRWLDGITSSMGMSLRKLSVSYHFALSYHTVHGALKARILKCFAIPFSRGPHSVRPLHHDPSVLGGPTWHGLVPLS